MGGPGSGGKLSADSVRREGFIVRLLPVGGWLEKNELSAAVRFLPSTEKSETAQTYTSTQGDAINILLRESRLTPELTRRPRAAFNFTAREDDESPAIERSGRMTC